MPEPAEIPHDAQITPAHVLEYMQQQVTPRLDKLEETVKESGLNGYSPYLKAFLEQYSATYIKRQAWLTVGSDVKHRLKWLAPGKHWLTVLFSAILGGLGWQIASGHLPIRFH